MKVSLLITTFNRAGLLSLNLKRLEELTQPDEIIVIDDGGTDNTREVCENSNLDITYVYNNNPGPTICSLARNIGIGISNYDFLITCEPELVFITDVIQQLKDNYEDHPEEICSAGGIYFGKKSTTKDELPPPNYTSLSNALGWVAPYTALWPKEWLIELGGWDEEFPGPWGWEDIDLLTRLRINKHGQYIDNSIEALHLWHGLGADKNEVNEKHFRSKSFINKGEEGKFGPEELKDLVANKNHDWGVLR